MSTLPSPLNHEGQEALVLLQGHRGGQRRRDSLVALVLLGTLQPGPIQALLLVVAGQDTKADRHAGADADVGEARRRGLADIVEVRRTATDDYAQRHAG